MTTTTTRAEHLQWCKDRALAYVQTGNLTEAFSSLASDLGKHPGTENHAAMQLGMMMLMGGRQSTPRQMEHFINGCN